MSGTNAEGLRDRTRRAVRDEITHAALELFLEIGYDQATTTDIARAAGLSPRSLFRYFATKEEVVISKLELGLGPLLAALRARPADEGPWTAMREVVASVHADPLDPRDMALLRLVFATPTLLAVYLQKLNTLHQEATVILGERAREAGQASSGEGGEYRAIAGAALSCLTSAQQTAVLAPDDGEISIILERSLSALGTIATEERHRTLETQDSGG